MDFECPVTTCKKLFSRPQDRLAHLQQRTDPQHRAHVRQQALANSCRFSSAVKAAHGATRGSNSRSKKRTRYSQPTTTGPSMANVPVAEPLDLDMHTHPDGDSFLLARDMEVDTRNNEEDKLFDEEGSIFSEEEALDFGDKAENALFEQDMNRTAQDLYGVELDEVENAFNFLPDLVTESASSNETDIASTPDTSSSYRPMNRFLVEDDDSVSWQWHPTAGRIYGQEHTVHERWQSIEGGDAEEGKWYGPFNSRLDWELAQWAVKEKVSQGAFDRFLLIPEVKAKLGLSFTSSRSMLEQVDQIPERCGPWFTKQLSFKDRPTEHFTIHHRDPIEAIKALWGDPSFAKCLVYKPGKMFRSSTQTEEERVFSEMWSGSFWNAAQSVIPEGGTIAPVIIATDKTQLTQFSGSKAAYPVYLTIGNIPKALRRKPGAQACILIAYLSVEKLATDNLSQTTLKLRNYELFHRSMAIVLEPLKAAGNPHGMGINMVGGDGKVRKVYPLLATYVADYPEQCLVACTKYGTCPKCRCPANELDIPSPSQPRTQDWTHQTIKDARRDLRGRGGNAVHKRTMGDDVAGGNYEPFWADFPLTDIHRCIAPDVLHQLYQGVLKHLVNWIQKSMGEDELDERIRRLPPTSGVRHFAKGISILSQVSGPEHKQIGRILLACLVGKMPSEGITACRGLLHFIQLAQYPSHDQDTLKYMHDALDVWNKHKRYFIRNGVREHFNIPKFHSLIHFADSIRWLGTTDNYNTETFERLHIDFAKEGWRASNHRNHFPQMVQFISRHEKISSFDFYRSWVSEPSQNNSSDDIEAPILQDSPEEAVLSAPRPTRRPQLSSSTTTPASDTLRSTTTAHKPVKDPPFSVATIFKNSVTAATPPSSNRPSPSIATIQQQLQKDPASPTVILLAKHPPEPNKKLSHIVVSHGVPGFLVELKLFLRSYLPPDQRPDKRTTATSALPFTSVDVWHSFKLTPAKLLDDPEREIVKAIPRSKFGVPRYDTVIVLDGDEAESTAVEGCRAARLRVIFRLPRQVDRHGFKFPAPKNWATEPLAYVTWFTRFKPAPDDATGMYRVDPALSSTGVSHGAIIPLSHIRQHCMMVPGRGNWEKHWTSENILDECPSFLVNNLLSKYAYQTIY